MFAFKSVPGARTLAKKRAARYAREHRKEMAEKRMPFSGVMQVDAFGWPKAPFASFASRPLVVLPVWLQLLLIFPEYPGNAYFPAQPRRDPRILAAIGGTHA